MDEYHIPVLLKEAIDFLNVRKGLRYIDATLGGGGHSLEIIKRGGVVLGIDCDSEAIAYTQKRLEAVYYIGGQACPLGVYQWKLVKGNFKDIGEIAKKEKFYPVSGILFDLGVSSHQLETPERGFSFNLEGPLDMRMDKELKVTAADLVNGLSENELTLIFKKFAEEFHSRAIAHAIVHARSLEPIKKADQLVKIILKTAGKRTKKDRSHPATRVFQALRICVNDEINNLKKGLAGSLNILDKEGRLVIISFHSLEDSVAKKFFKENAKLKKVEILTKKPISPKKLEVKKNPKSRSAKLRAVKII